VAAKKPKIVSTLLPATRSVRLLREKGYVADMAERKMGLLSKDWGGFADLMGIRRGLDEGIPPFGWSEGEPDVVFIQATGWSNTSSRVKKVLANPDAYDCVRAGCRVFVHGWDRRKEEPKVIDLSDPDLYEPLPYGHPDRP